MFAAAIAGIAAPQPVFHHAAPVRAPRAARGDAGIAPLTGANDAHVSGLAAAAGEPGIRFATAISFDPAAGAGRLLLACEAALIGGPGDIWWMLMGGIILGGGRVVGARIDAGRQSCEGRLALPSFPIPRARGPMPKATS